MKRVDIRRVRRAVSAAAVALLLTGSALAQTVTNGGFESGDFTGWSTIGKNQVIGTDVGTNPPAGIKQALIESNEDGAFNASITAGSGVNEATFEAAFHLTAGSLAGLTSSASGGAYGVPKLSSGIVQQLPMYPGQTVTIQHDMLTGQVYIDYKDPANKAWQRPNIFNNDYIFVSVSDGAGNQTVTPLLDTFWNYTNPAANPPANFTTGFVLADYTKNPFYSEAGYQTYTFTVPTAGLYYLGIGVVHPVVNGKPDDGYPSGALIDAVSISPSISAVALNSHQVVGGVGTTGTITVDNTSTNDIHIPMGSNNPAYVTGDTADITSGNTSGTFNVTTLPVPSDTTVQVRAYYGPNNFFDSVLVKAPTISSIGISSDPVVGGSDNTATINLTSTSAASPGMPIALDTDNHNAATVPSSVSMVSETAHDVTVTTFPVNADTLVTLSAVVNGATTNKSFTVSAPVVSSVNSPGGTGAYVVGGTVTNGSVTLSSTARSDLPITVDTDDHSVATISNVSVSGATVSFLVNAVYVSSDSVCNITTSLNGSTSSAVLNVHALALANLIISPATATVQGGTNVNLAPVLTYKAPVGGADVSITGGGTTIVDTTITVPSGSYFAYQSIATAPVSVDTTVTLTATYNGTTKTVGVNVNAPTVKYFAFSPTPVAAGGNTTVGLSISGPAPTGGLSVTLNATPANVVNVPNTITVPAGQLYVLQTVSTAVVNTSTPVQIDAVLNGTTTSTTVTVNPVTLIGMTVNQATLQGGHQGTFGYIYLSSPAPTGGISVNVASDNAAAAFPSSSTVSIPAGQTYGVYSVYTKVVGSQATPTITASYGSSSQAVQLTITP